MFAYGLNEITKRIWVKRNERVSVAPGSIIMHLIFSGPWGINNKTGSQQTDYVAGS